MASSSLSQESLDHDDFELSTRRCRNKVIRNRAPPAYNKNESLETADDKDEDSFQAYGAAQCAVDCGTTLHPGTLSAGGHVSFSSGSCDRDSPTRSKVKDKRAWPGHSLHKVKPGKDKRKLREKRRSSGLAHVHSTESTGDSLEENDKEAEVHRCNAHNEVIDADNPQTPEEDSKGFTSRKIRNKSPSDLDADFEDNQDYDSTVSQSENNSSRVTSTSKLQTLPAGKPVDSATIWPTPSSQDTSGVASTADGGRGRTGELEMTPSHRAGGHHHHQIINASVEFEELLVKEREANRRLVEQLNKKDLVIAELERKIDQLSQANH